MEVSPSVSIPSNSVLAQPTLDIRSKTDGDRIVTYVLFFSCLVCVHAAGTFYSSKCRQPAQAKPYKPAVWYKHLDPIFGLDILVPYLKAFSQSRLLEWTRSTVSSYGRTVSWLCLGKQAVLTYDPVNVKAILSGQFEDFGLGETRKVGWEPLFGNGISNSEGTLWKHHRSTLRPLLARVRDVELGIFETHFQALKAVLPRNGTTFDIQQLFGSFILDASTEVFLGASTGLLSSQKTHNTEGQKFADAFDYAQRVVIGIDNLSISSLLQKVVFGDQRLHDSLNFVDQFIYKMLDNALHQRDEIATQERDDQAHSESLLSTLITEGRSKSEIKCDIVNVILATRDTTTAYISSIWYLLSKHPDVYNKVLAEISVLNGRPPTKEDFHRFTYLQMVLQEVIRLFPPVAINQRTAEVDTVLPHGGGHDGKSPMLVRRGTSVGYSVYAMHRIPEFFGPDADDFRPERWNDIRPGPAYMPFHAGPRACLGKQFALALVKYCTIRLMQHLPQPQDRNDHPWQEKLALNCSSKHGVKIAF